MKSYELSEIEALTFKDAPLPDPYGRKASRDTDYILKTLEQFARVVAYELEQVQRSAYTAARHVEMMHQLIDALRIDRERM